MAIATTEDERSFERMWKEAQVRFAETTGQILVQTQSLEDVLIELNKRFDAQDSNDGGKNQRIKELASNVLNFIDLLCGIAAQGVSAVFGPASLCFNAMQALINIPAKVSKFHDDLALLFEEISAFMKQFKIYRRIEQFAEVDIELKQCTHKVMIVFVDICALSIDILSGSRWKKIKTVTKIALFDNDSGVRDKLEELRRLITQQGQISDAVTLEHVLRSEKDLTSSVKTVFDMLKKASQANAKSMEELEDTHDDVRAVKAGTEALLKDANERTSEHKQQEQFIQICKKLSLEPENLQRSEKDLDQMRSDRIQATGDWLKDMDVYQQWIDLKSEIDSPLLLSGSNGTGKSHLAIAILDDLKTRYSNASGSSSRASFAVHRFVTDERLSGTDAVKKALKAMAAQIAKGDVVFSKRIFSHLESKDPSFSKDTRVEDLPKELIPPPNMKDAPDISYVLIFDGVDQLSDDAAKQLSRAILAMKSPKVRIMLTGAEEIIPIFSNASDEGSNTAMNIRVADHNEADVKRFIDSELKACRELQGSRPGISRIVQKIQKDLPEIAKGNFNDVRQIFENVVEAVKSLKEEEDIINLISEDTLKNKHSATERLIMELQGSLNVQEIEQLNEILIWTIYAYKYVSVDEMQAALILRTKKMPLQSLEDKVGQKYSRLLHINPDNDNVFEMRNSYLEEFFKNSKRQENKSDAGSNNDPKISMTITIDGVKLSKVQRFLWDLSEKVLLDKFTFRNNLTDPGPNIVISANRTDSHLALARRCFDLLLDEPREETKAIVQYALMEIPWHLSAMVNDVSENILQTAEREELVQSLVSLLQEVVYIERHLTEEFFRREAWLAETELEAIRWWLCEPRGKLNRKELSWVKQAVSDKDRKLLALKDIAGMVARHWLCQRTWSAELPFHWLDVFLDRWIRDKVQDDSEDEPHTSVDGQVSLDKVDAVTTSDGDSVKETISISSWVLRAAEWAENGAKLTKNSLWYERLGDTYLYHGEVVLATEAFLKSKELPDTSWKVSEGLANAYAEGNKLDLALVEMEVVLAYLRGMQDPTTVEKDSLVQDLIKAAGWQREDINGAIDKLREAIRIDEHYYQSHIELLKVFIHAQQGSEALKFLGDMGTQPAKDGKVTQFEAMLVEFSKGENLLDFETVCIAVRNHDMAQVILQTVRKAITYAQESKEDSNLAGLFLFHGIALAGYSTEENRLESALMQWTECYKVGLQSPIWERQQYALSATKYIFNHHFSEARSKQNAVKDSETPVKLLEDLAGSTRYIDVASTLRLLHGSFYILLGKQDEAQKLLLNDMKSGIDLLSDDDPENDYYGYSMMANVFMHSGDDLNALSAWSLYGPTERRKGYGVIRTEQDEEVKSSSKAQPAEAESKTGENGTDHITIYCDGRCNKPLTYADSLWFCKVCEDVQFEDECFRKLQEGTLTRFVCSPDHEWLRVPSWTDEYRATGNGRVRVGGELHDGKRVGGEIVDVEKWLDLIREKWGIKKPVSEVENGEDKAKTEEEI